MTPEQEQAMNEKHGYVLEMNGRTLEIILGDKVITTIGKCFGPHMFHKLSGYKHSDRQSVIKKIIARQCA